MSLKVVKFDTKIFQIFGDEPRLGGGDKPWSKNGDKCQMGGIGKIFAEWGTPSPPRKKPCELAQNLKCVKVYFVCRSM